MKIQNQCMQLKCIVSLQTHQIEIKKNKHMSIMVSGKSTDNEDTRSMHEITMNSESPNTSNGNEEKQAYEYQDIRNKYRE